MDTSKLDVDALFKQYSIKEIQAIELQIKNEIEKKKEDLRIMVYNRYRDLIDAADGIHVMKNCSKQIENVLNDLQVVSEKIFNDKDNTMFADQEKQRSIEKTKRNNKYILAVVIKILQNTPTKIWYHLDNHEYLKAAKQYLIAQNAHACIDIEKSLKNQENFQSYLQYANELWKSIVFLSNTIAGKARSTLFLSKSDMHSSSVLIDSICCIYLLENVSIKSLFEEYLSTRNEIICSVIDHDKSSDFTGSIKDRVVDCLRMFVQTIHHLYDMFSADPANKSASYEALITDSSFTVESLKDDGVVVSKIPTYLKNIKFKDVGGVQKFDQDYLSAKCAEWLDKCLDILKARIESVLKYAASLKSLALIRDAVTQFENGLNSVQPGVDQANWNYVFQSIFKRKLEIWSQLVAPFYYSQSKFIIETSFKTTHDNFMRNLRETMENNTFEIQTDKNSAPESDLNSYLWSIDVFNLTNEGLTDLAMTPGNQKKQIDFFPATMANKPLSVRSLSNRQLYSTLKQYSTTPIVQRLCKQFDDDLVKLLNDIEFESVDSDDDVAIKNAHLRENLLAFSDNLYQSLFQMVESMKQEDSVNVRKILFVCRLVHALPYTCPNLRACFSSLVDRTKIDLGASPTFTKTKTTKQILEAKNPSDELWHKIMEKLFKINKIGIKIWIEILCKEVSKSYLSRLTDPHSSSYPFISSELISWDEIEIEEELNEDLTSSSGKLKSKLSVPLVCSAAIQNILYWLSQQLTKNLNYTMINSSHVLKDLILNVLDLVVKSYHGLFDTIQSQSASKKIITQNQALQILFDLKFLFTLFDIKSVSLGSPSATAYMDQRDEELVKIASGLNEEYKNVTGLYESLIDPFDYDICMPFIQSNVVKCIARSTSLFGVLSINEKQQFKSSSTMNTAATNSNEKFNLIPLSNVQHRFELLPILTSQPSQPQSNKTNQQQNQSSSQANRSQAANMKMDDLSKKSANSSSGIFGFKWF